MDMNNTYTILFWYLYIIQILIIHRMEVTITFISYLIVALKDPGYVTSYALRGDEFEDDLE